MVTYDVIEISTGNVVFSDPIYENCINWIDTYGDIIHYTIVEHQGKKHPFFTTNHLFIP